MKLKATVGIRIYRKCTLYHYTSLDTLVKILRRDKIYLHATSCNYLNDTKEATQIIDSLKPEIDVCFYKQDFRNYFITSFSKKPDDLAMWNIYGNRGSGVAIGFSTDIFKKEESEHNTGFDFDAHCIYGDDEIKRWYKERRQLREGNCSIKTEENGNFDGTFDKTCLASKNIAFKQEEEVRGIAYRDISSKDIDFKVRNGLIVPYVALSFPKDVLEEIVIGPTANSESTRESILEFLEINGYNINPEDVKNSVIPYRG